MNSSPNVHICPIKQLYLQLPSMKLIHTTAAVLCTMNDIDSSRLEGLQYLHLSFADVLHGPDVFRTEQAQSIRAFVDNLTDITDLYFCCDSGESRSAALACAFMHYFNQDEMSVWRNIKYHPNEWVYYAQSIACDLLITREDAQQMAEYNRMLFHRAISKQFT